MKTACWFGYFGPGRIGISLGVPRVAGGFKIHKILAPIPGTLKLPYQKFVESYNGKLNGLNARNQWDICHQLAGDAEPVLLCWEKPPFRVGNWCHRRLTAEWFQRELGEVVEEMGWGNCPHMPTQEQNDALIRARQSTAIETSADEEAGDLENWVGRTGFVNHHQYTVVGVNPKVAGTVDVRRDDGVVVTISADVLLRYFR